MWDVSFYILLHFTILNSPQPHSLYTMYVYPFGIQYLTLTYSTKTRKWSVVRRLSYYYCSSLMFLVYITWWSYLRCVASPFIIANNSCDRINYISKIKLSKKHIPGMCKEKQLTTLLFMWNIPTRGYIRNGHKLYKINVAMECLLFQGLINVGSSKNNAII